MISYLFKSLKNRRNQKSLHSLGILRIGKAAKVEAQIQFLNGVDPSTCVLEIGEGSFLRGKVSFERNNATLRMGENSSVNNSLLAVSNLIEIGHNVLISYECLIMDHNGHSLNLDIRKKDLMDVLQNKPKSWNDVSIGKIVLSDGVWVGARTLILKNVVVGANTVLAAGCVVTKSLPADVVAGGNPAKIIRENR